MASPPSRRTAVRRWESKDGFLLVGEHLPSPQLPRRSTQVGSLAEVVSYPAVTLDRYSLMKVQSGPTCKKKLHRYLLQQKENVLQQIRPQLNLSTSTRGGDDEFSCIGVVTKLHVSDGRLESDGGAPSYWNISVFEEAEDDGATLQSFDLRVWTGQLRRTTGVHLGCVVGVIGEVTNRDLHHNVVSVTARQYFLPLPAPCPWTVVQTEEQQQLGQPSGTSSSLPALPLRLQFVSGPFPADAAIEILQSIILQAVERTVDILVIGGPLVECAVSPDRLPDKAFPDMLFDICDAIADCRKGTRVKVILVPSLDDATLTPVLPQLFYDYPLEEEEDGIILGSNPFSFSCSGVRFAVGGFDPLPSLIERMEEGGGIESELVGRSGIHPGALNPLLQQQRAIEALLSNDTWILPGFGGKRSGLIDLSLLDGLRLSQSTSKNSNPLKKEETGSVAPPVLPHVIVFPSNRIPSALYAQGLMAEESGPLIIDLGNATMIPQRDVRGYALHVAEITLADPDLVVREGPKAKAGVSVQSRLIFRKEA